MLTGCVTVQWEDERGAFRREAVTSYEGDMQVVRLSCDASDGLQAEIALLPPKSFSGGKRATMERGRLEAPEKCEELLTVEGDTLSLIHI